MAKSKLYYGSIQVSKLNNAAKDGHVAFYKGEDGKIYARIKLWLTDEPDDYGNHISIHLDQPKEETAKKVYVASLKESESKTAALKTADLEEIPTDGDLPF